MWHPKKRKTGFCSEVRRCTCSKIVLLNRFELMVLLLHDVLLCNMVRALWLFSREYTAAYLNGSFLLLAKHPLFHFKTDCYKSQTMCMFLIVNLRNYWNRVKVECKKHNRCWNLAIFTVLHCIFFQGKAHQHQTKLSHHLCLHLIRIHQHTLPKDHQKNQSSQVDLCHLNNKSYHQKSLLQTNLLVVFQDSSISQSPQHFNSHLLIQVELPLLAVSL